jgi:hypothetical protein
MNGFHWCLETVDFDGAVAQLEADGVDVAQAPHDTDAHEAKEKGCAALYLKARMVSRLRSGGNITILPLAPSLYESLK